MADKEKDQQYLQGVQDGLAQAQGTVVALKKELLQERLISLDAQIELGRLMKEKVLAELTELDK